MSYLPPYSEKPHGPCPKCGYSFVFTLVYRPSRREYIGEDHIDIPESLTHTCPMCGYRKVTAPRDARTVP